MSKFINFIRSKTRPRNAMLNNFGEWFVQKEHLPSYVQNQYYFNYRYQKIKCGVIFWKEVDCFLLQHSPIKSI